MHERRSRSIHATHHACVPDACSDDMAVGKVLRSRYSSDSRQPQKACGSSDGSSSRWLWCSSPAAGCDGTRVLRGGRGNGGAQLLQGFNVICLDGLVRTQQCLEQPRRHGPGRMTNCVLLYWRRPCPQLTPPRSFTFYLIPSGNHTHCFQQGQGQCAVASLQPGGAAHAAGGLLCPSHPLIPSPPLIPASYTGTKAASCRQPARRRCCARSWRRPRTTGWMRSCLLPARRLWMSTAGTWSRGRARSWTAW